MVNIKVLWFLTAIFVIVASVPAKSPVKKIKEENKALKEFRFKQMEKLNDERYSENYKKLLENSIKLSETKIQEANSISFRLPNNTIPLYYSINLRTDIHRGDSSFRGNVEIHIKVLEQTNTITLHARQLVIFRINLFTADGNIFQFNAPFTMDSELEFLTITTDRMINVDEEFHVEIEYGGFLNQNLQGFFGGFYMENNERISYATTALQPHFARHAFPCYDEVRFRTPFALEIDHHRSFHAVSNMPVQSVTGVETVKTRFEPTPMMPTHLLTFTISNFDRIQNNDPELPMSVYAVPSAIAAGQGEYGLDLGEKMLRTMEKLFDIPYSLPKADQIAIPNFWPMGTESWGLMSMLDNVLLHNYTTGSWRETTDLQIAHEFAVRIKCL
jgi:aminopeptidase N